MPKPKLQGGLLVSHFYTLLLGMSLLGSSPVGLNAALNAQNIGQRGSKRYVVREGDTLWSISQALYQDPWRWPKLWSYNPHIRNPNWIYPGTLILLGPDDTGAPRVTREESQAISAGIGAQMAGAGVIDFWGNRYATPMRLRPTLLLSSEALQGVGRVKYSPEERLLLSTGDRIYLELGEGQSASVDEVFQIYAQSKVFRHPKKREKVGQVVKLVGEAQVIKSDGDGQPVARITRTLDIIERGQYVLKEDSVMNFHNIVPKNANPSLRGMVLGAASNSTRSYAQEHFIITDLGRSEGAEAGDIFHIMRGYDPVKKKRKNLNRQAIGVVMLVDVYDEASVGIIRRSVQEINAGDFVVVN